MSEKILVIDDEQNIRESSVKLLRQKGYDASCTGSGAEALTMIQQGTFDLLLLDVRMPGIDGIETLRRATELIPDIQVLMLTGHGTIDTAIEAMKYGAIGFLRKPIVIHDLQMSIDDALARGKTRKENTRLRALLPLFELNKQLLAELDEGKIIDIILKTVNSEIVADYTEITLWDEDTSHIIKFASNNLAIDHGRSVETDKDMALRVSATMNPLVFSRADKTIRETWDDIHLINSDYDVYIPLVARNKPIGMVKVTKLMPHKPLQSSSLEFLFVLCSQSSIGIYNARLYASLEKAHIEVEELLKRVITNTEDERLRISLELHDGPIQSIIASQFSIQACRGLLHDNMAMTQIDEKLQNIGKALLESTHNLRRIVSDLHPPDLEKSGLLSAIQEYLSLIENDGIMKCTLKVKGKVVKLAYSTERGLYYMVREAITNIKKHAEASTIKVTIEFQDENLIVTVSDDGKGFDPSKEEHNSTIEHVGIRGIKERARVLRSNVTIDSKHGEGTTVKLVLPLSSHIQQQSAR
ncbi:MAG: response regulator [Dehalococcoidales bacterium]|nr:response regulator [Dehalococcoidales bacterium]